LFIPSDKYKGEKKNYQFTTGEKGLGYYYKYYYDEFIPSEHENLPNNDDRFKNSREWYVFKNDGDQGPGYYIDETKFIRVNYNGKRKGFVFNTGKFGTGYYSEKITDEPLFIPSYDYYDFIPNALQNLPDNDEKFKNIREWYVFKNGYQGRGYYLDEKKFIRAYKYEGEKTGFVFTIGKFGTGYYSKEIADKSFFIPRYEYKGEKKNYKFKDGEEGLGYYYDLEAIAQKTKTENLKQFQKLWEEAAIQPMSGPKDALERLTHGGVKVKKSRKGSKKYKKTHRHTRKQRK
jgi:hypothetical protein